jgi:beta-N-acetylhexosaminidase
MTSHIVNMKLDVEGNPGTLSPEIITGILRKRMNYPGVVFSDDMQMHAITKHFGFEEAIKKAINAGVDIMTFSNNITGSDLRTVDKVHEIIRQMVFTGEIKETRIDESFRRIMALKKKLADGHRLVILEEELGKAIAENQALKEQLRKKDEQIASLQQPEPKKKKKKKR